MNTRFRTRYPFQEEAGTSGGASAPAAPAPAPGADPAAGAPAAPAPAPAVPGTGQPGPAWLAADTNPELLGHAQNKAWKTAADVVQSHRELEKLLGADRAGRTVTVPADENDAAGWEQVYNRLGRPPAPEAYKLPVPEGHAPEFARAAAGEFHKLGLSERQGQALASWWNAQAQKAQADRAAAEEVALRQEHEALARDWGAEHDARREIARRSALALGQKAGLDQGKLQTALDTLEKVGGYSTVLKLLATAGDLMREHGAAGIADTVPGSFAMTPEGAKARRSQLMADKEWTAKAIVPNSAQWAELQRLDRIIAGS